MSWAQRLNRGGWWWLLAALAVTCAIYAPGLSGGFLFDDYPNIVDNQGVQPHEADLGALVRAALSSPSSEFKRPLASLSFAANYLATGLDPYWMKVTNLVIHLVNGLLTFLLCRLLLDLAGSGKRSGLIAAWIAGAWMVLPINLTGVLYIVQRMESMANAFVLLGLLGYIAGRRRMLAPAGDAPSRRRTYGALALCVASLVVPTAIGMLAKETAVMLPLYAALVEWLIFRFRKPLSPRERGWGEGAPIAKIGRSAEAPPGANASPRDWRILTLFLVVLVLPLLVGLAWLLPGLLEPEQWATRDFTLATRLLSEARIVTDYIGWTLLPTPGALSFYHDDFVPSAGWLHPWTTLAGLLSLVALFAAALWLRRRRPLAALGILLFLGCHLLTGTILPLELIYEHRNYFASFGLLLAIVPWLAPQRHVKGGLPAASAARTSRTSLMSLLRYIALGGLTLFWVAQTMQTAYAWGDPLRLAAELADRAPASSRAQYELGRTYIIYSHYDPKSPYTQLAYAPLERAMRLPDSSILPEQALIFMNARMGLTIKDAWWDSLVAKLKAHQAGVQDESSLGALAMCAREGLCNLPKSCMTEAFTAALSHPHPSARLLAEYGDYAWNVLGDHPLGLQLISEAVQLSPAEPAYQITRVRMLVATNRMAEARRQLAAMQRLNIGGRLNGSIAELRSLLPDS